MMGIGVHHHHPSLITFVAQLSSVRRDPGSFSSMLYGGGCPAWQVRQVQIQEADAHGERAPCSGVSEWTDGQTDEMSDERKGLLVFWFPVSCFLLCLCCRPA